jgi:lipoprotein signal peptidase
MTERPARSFRWMLWGLALLGLSLDQATKYTVFPWLHQDHVGLVDDYGGKYYEVIPGAFRLRVLFSNQLVTGDGPLSSLRAMNGKELPAVNHGALFGIGGDYTLTANTIFMIISVLAAAAIIYWSMRRSTARDWSLCTALGLILGGTLGNLYDRIVFGGVRDFLYWYAGIDWPVFNFADCCLVCGAFLLLVQAFWHRAPVEQADNVGAVSREVVEAK